MTTYASELTARLSALPYQLVGVVDGDQGDDLTIHVRTEQGVLRARRATSCLVQPIAGDRVWVASIGEEGAYILAVLDRAGPQPLQLALDRDATIRTQGTLTVAASQGLALRTPKELSVDAQGLMVKATKARVFLQVASIFGKVLSAAVGSISVAGNRMESYFEQLVQTSKTSTRHVAQADMLTCGSADYRAENLLRMHGENVIVTAEELVKSDGKQIHFG